MSDAARTKKKAEIRERNDKRRAVEERNAKVYEKKAEIKEAKEMVEVLRAEIEELAETMAEELEVLKAEIEEKKAKVEEKLAELSVMRLIHRCYHYPSESEYDGMSDVESYPYRPGGLIPYISSDEEECYSSRSFEDSDDDDEME